MVNFIKKFDAYWDNFYVVCNRGSDKERSVYLMPLGKIKIVPKLQVNEKVCIRKYFDPLLVWSEVKMCLRSSQNLK